jgi:hypothetical protein
MKIKLLLQTDVYSKETKVVQASFNKIEVPEFNAKYRYSFQEIELSESLPKQPNAIYWEVSDFEKVASSLELEANTKLFDRSKFEETLHDMIDQHDSLYGIGTLDVEEYLKSFCLLERKKKK